VTEQYLKEPIVSAGYHIGPHFDRKYWGQKNGNIRRYAIVGIEKIQYKPATLTLAKILFDKSELDIFRGRRISNFNYISNRRN